MKPIQQEQTKPLEEFKPEVADISDEDFFFILKLMIALVVFQILYDTVMWFIKSYLFK